ncbi:MAG: lantibiotic dehydratase [Chryseobacterium sp.]|uniref:lantibiotic dehydratase n=1 Tax=Chryseobacterium sp. TaxID=1871047 RepID=UPI0025BECE45|nr:lantibiotic dehydratase [Chryseobacterium sp.]MCJ7932648.1 lantibiotic dehydratase [Chryseobacterium sp.]
MGKKLHLADFGSYIIRKPAFPFTLLFEKDGTTKNMDDLISAFWEDETFRSAIYWSSSQLYEMMMKYQNNTLKSDKKARLFNTLKKYIIRTTTRGTPYGTFAGSTVSSFNTAEAEENSSRHTLYRKAHIDRTLFSKLIAGIESNGQLREKLKYRTNPTIYLQHLKYRYLAVTDNDYHLNSIDKTEFIDLVYRHASEKMLSISEMADLLPQEFDREKLMEFILELIDIQFLQSEISDTLYAPDELSTAENFLRPYTASAEAHFFYHLIRELQSTIEEIDRTPLPVIPFSQLYTIKAQLKHIGLEAEHLFHIDFRHSPADIEPLHTQLLKDIKAGINFLHQIKSEGNPAAAALNEFKKKFTSVYESQEIPLVQILDPDTGIGFPVNKGIGTHYNDVLIDKIATADIIAKDNKVWAPSWLIELIEKSKPGEPIDLALASVPKQENPASLPPTFYAMGNVLERQQFFLQSAGGTSAKTLLGRFTHLDCEIQKLYDDISVFEKAHNPEIITANIIFIPRGKAANVTRPMNTSEYEINIIGESLAENTKIRIEDLLVSIVGDEIILRSEKLDKRIVPVLSNAHNFHHSDTVVYKFLASLQHQHASPIGLNIDCVKSRKPYIPRIIYGNIILQRATWILFETDIRAINSSKNPVSALMDILRKLKTSQFVVFVKGDHELFIDTHNASYVEILADEIKKSETATLCEWLFQKPTDQNSYINQVLIPFKNPGAGKINPVLKIHSSDIQKTFLPGSKWFYFKIYCSATFSDILLSQVIAPLLDQWMEAKIIEKGFFIRYQDPDYHIRLRLLLSDEQYFASTVVSIHSRLKPFVEQNIIQKTKFSTYIRETERYGSRHMEDIESFFAYDSQLVFTMLAHEDFTEDIQLRTLLAVKNIDFLLSHFKLTAQEKLDFCKKMEQYFEREFRKEEKFNIYNEYRNISSALYSIMESSDYDSFFWERSMALQPLDLGTSNITSIIHMSTNRWFPAKQRLYEYLIYIFAGKYYQRIQSKNS